MAHSWRLLADCQADVIHIHRVGATPPVVIGLKVNLDTLAAIGGKIRIVQDQLPPDTVVGVRIVHIRQVMIVSILVND